MRRSHSSSRGFLAALESGKSKLLALRVVRLRDLARQRAHAKDVALPLGDADRAARVEQIERVARLHDLLVGRQWQSRVDELLRFALADVEPVQELADVRE